jgi:hypothetical protein
MIKSNRLGGGKAGKLGGWEEVSGIRDQGAGILKEREV